MRYIVLYKFYYETVLVFLLARLRFSRSLLRLGERRLKERLQENGYFFGRGVLDILRRHRAVGAGPVLDHDRLLERGAERIGDDAADRVAGAAGPEYGDESNRPRRKIVGIERDGKHDRRRGHDQRENTSCGR